jgi:hypothetical protein
MRSIGSGGLILFLIFVSNPFFCCGWLIFVHRFLVYF